jgi:transposase InsO family protein
LGEAMLDTAALTELLGKNGAPAAGREAVAHLRGGFAMSERRACRVVAVDRSSVRYRRRGCDDALRERLKALAEERRRFGYRCLWVLLRREGHTVNPKRVYRLYKEERLMVAPTRRAQTRDWGSLAAATAGRAKPALVA